jgi:hypothetical protein
MRSRSYDTAGQLLSDTIRGNGMTFTHDPEGSLLTESFPSFTSVTTMNYTYNVRGELIDSNSGSPGWGEERLEWAGSCGTHVAIAPNAEADPLNLNNPPIMDARSCAPVASGEIDKVEYENALYPTGSTNKVSYDAAGRAIHTVTYTATFASPDGIALGPEPQTPNGTPAPAATPFPDAGDASNVITGGGEIGSIQRAWGSGVIRSVTAHTITLTKTVDTAYDAENHTVSRAGSFVRTSAPVNSGGTATPAPTPTPTPTTMSTVLGWGPNGHPALAYPGTAAAMTFHWDGDVILFVTDVNGNVVDFKVGLDGEITPRDTTWTGLTVFDRDQGGMVIDTATPTQNFFDPLDTDGSPTQNASWMVPQYAPYYRTDGFYVGDIQINGVRAVDPTVGAWTTPDAYEGDIHDPMSQQKYMFNRNNAVDYSDPSGYDPGQSARDAGTAVLNFLILDDWHTATDSKKAGWERALAIAALASNLGGPEIKGGGFVLSKVVKFGVDDLAHVAARHFVESTGSDASGRFLAGTTTGDVKKMVEHSLDHPHQIDPSRGRIMIHTDFGMKIGTSNGKDATILRTITDIDGNFITAFPVRNMPLPR